jgi:hypothetical protein
MIKISYFSADHVNVPLEFTSGPGIVNGNREDILASAIVGIAIKRPSVTIPEMI